MLQYVKRQFAEARNAAVSYYFDLSIFSKYIFHIHRFLSLADYIFVTTM